MRSKMLGKLSICWSLIWFGQLYCFEFDQNYFGVVFSPYVKNFSDGVHPYERITRSNIKTMLTVASGKFTNLLVQERFVKQDYYFHKLTYNSGCYSTVYAGESAAITNKENGSRKIRIVYQLMDFGAIQQTRWDISVALEAAEKANNIFPGTVEGISLYAYDDLQLTLNHLHIFQRQASALGIKLGADLDCYQLGEPKNETSYTIARKIVETSDFIICSSMKYPPMHDAAKAWPSMGKSFISFKRIIGQIKSSVEVVAYSAWPSSGLEEGESLENVRVYWEMASHWAAENRYKIYMLEAFDVPNRFPNYPDINGQYGWWMLRPNSDIDSLDGYLEKVLEVTGHMTTPPTTTKEDQMHDTSGDKPGNNDSSKSWRQQSFFLLTTAVAFVRFYFHVA